MKTVSLNVEKWLRLCRQAEQAALLHSPNTAAKDLHIAAGRLTTITEPLTTPFVTALATSFRWDCTTFGLALPEYRALLADELGLKARLLMRLLTPEPEGVSSAVAVPPIEAAPAVAHPWQARADIGGL